MNNDRTVPAGVRREIDRQESPEFYLTFLTIKHKTLIEPIRVVGDPKNFTLDGHLFRGSKFSIQLLSDTEGMPEARLSIQNIDRRIGQAIQVADDPAKLKIEVITGSQFDLTVEPRIELGASERVYSADQLILHGVQGNSIALTGSIRSWDYTQELYPGMRATQDRFPGLFR